MKMASPSAISIKSKKCGSPGRVYSPRPKLQEYMQSLTNQSVCNITGRTDGITREVISSISPNNRQFSQNNNQTLCNQKLEEDASMDHNIPNQQFMNPNMVGYNNFIGNQINNNLSIYPFNYDPLYIYNQRKHHIDSHEAN